MPFLGAIFVLVATFFAATFLTGVIAFFMLFVFCCYDNLIGDPKPWSPLILFDDDLDFEAVDCLFFADAAMVSLSVLFSFISPRMAAMDSFLKAMSSSFTFWLVSFGMIP